jgi:hypothetical protein
MKLNETKYNPGGLMRCCLDTIFTLDESDDFADGTILDCKHEKSGNQNIILDGGTWRWNSEYNQPPADKE